jgi:hypothetical protein
MTRLPALLLMLTALCSWRLTSAHVRLEQICSMNPRSCCMRRVRPDRRSPQIKQRLPSSTRPMLAARLPCSRAKAASFQSNSAQGIYKTNDIVTYSTNFGDALMLEKISTGSRERCFDIQSTVTSQFWVSLTDV